MIKILSTAILKDTCGSVFTPGLANNEQASLNVVHNYSIIVSQNCFSECLHTLFLLQYCAPVSTREFLHILNNDLLFLFRLDPD